MATSHIFRIMFVNQGKVYVKTLISWVDGGALEGSANVAQFPMPM